MPDGKQFFLAAPALIQFILGHTCLEGAEAQECFRPSCEDLSRSSVMLSQKLYTDSFCLRISG